ncbi:MAG: hypothetical protein SXA11_07635 [Cyanobacteriota bacterium]|nr:hypothetical protein [Cyanobacteriota bacterium]
MDIWNRRFGLFYGEIKNILLAEVGNRQQATGNREEFFRKKEPKTIFFLLLQEV